MTHRLQSEGCPIPRFVAILDNQAGDCCVFVELLWCPVTHGPRSEPYAASLGLLGYELATAGYRDSALAVQHMLQTRARRGYVSPTALALVEIGLGHRDSAFAELRRAIAARDADLISVFPFDRTFDSLRSDARFAELKLGMNLPP